MTLFLLAFVGRAFCAEPVPQKYTLDNGLTLLITEVPSSSSVAVYALIKTGSAVEGKYLGSGISHFVEHMLFKGTKKRAVSQIAQEVKALGGNINASTTFDYTMYTIELPAGTFDKALDIISDMLMNSQFDAKEMEKERAVIFGEMRLYYDNPERVLSQMVFENAYLRHPYRHPIIGYEPLFAKISHEDILDYYHSTYTPNNIVLSIAGQVSATEVLEKVKEAFKDFELKVYPIRNLPPEPAQITPRRAQKEYKTDLTRMSLAYQGVSVLDQDMPALDVLSMILGQGGSSRLFLEIYKKKGLVYSISSSNFTPMDKGIFEIECLLEEKNVDKTLAAVKEQIALIQKNGAEPRELKKIQRQVLSQHVFDNQTAEQIADRMAFDEAFAGDKDFSKRYMEVINQVTSNDIKRVAQKYLAGNRLSVSILNPQKENKESSQEAAPEKPSEIEKFVLDNGMVVLLREDHTFPIVSVSLVLNGGTRQETADNNGISQLTSDLWTKGTKTRTAQAISTETESRGMSLRGFSGRNSFGLTFSLLSEDFNFGVDLLEDLIKNPGFPEDEFQKSKEATQAAIRARDDNIFAVTSKAMRETLFLKHSFRLEGLGTPESVAAIKRTEVADFYKRLSVPNNMVLAVFGDIKKTEMLEILKKKFLGLKKENLSPVQEKEDPVQGAREKTIQMDKEQAMVMVGFQSPAISSHDRYGMEVIASIMGSSLNGRIFLKIRDELGQSYTLGGNYTPGIDMGVSAFFVSTTNEQVKKVQEILLSQIKELQTTDVTNEELNHTKTYLKGTFAMGLETNSALAFASSLDELYGLGFSHYKTYDQEIDRVTKADIKRLAQKYLDPQKCAVVLTIP
ncbi:MAG TPA: pitrilysin family protein [Candidatus Omnitrophota bacterium]|nr:pitrilysin family protein [Candidatus Omnitrophota bacterium]